LRRFVTFLLPSYAWICSSHAQILYSFTGCSKILSFIVVALTLRATLSFGSYLFFFFFFFALLPFQRGFSAGSRSNIPRFCLKRLCKGPPTSLSFSPSLNETLFLRFSGGSSGFLDCTPLSRPLFSSEVRFLPHTLISFFTPVFLLPINPTFPRPSGTFATCHAHPLPLSFPSPMFVPPGRP